MPPPSSENDLKRLARRRLIGAVALTLLAVIVLPLLLEDEPPPTSSLAIHMPPAPLKDEAGPNQGTGARTEVPAASATPQAPLPSAPAESAPKAESRSSTEAAVGPGPEPEPKPKAETKPETKPRTESKPAAEPTRPKPVEVHSAPPPKAEPDKAVVAHAPEAGSGAFVVQLAALSDGAKARELKARAALAGLPVYTDTVGKLTRVRVGPYTTREAAVAAAARLSENGMPGKVLTR